MVVRKVNANSVQFCKLDAFRIQQKQILGKPEELPEGHLDLCPVDLLGYRKQTRRFAEGSRKLICCTMKITASPEETGRFAEE